MKDLRKYSAELVDDHCNAFQNSIQEKSYFTSKPYPEYSNNTKIRQNCI